MELGEADAVTGGERKGRCLRSKLELTDGFRVERFSLVGEADSVVGYGHLSSLEEREDGFRQHAS